MAQNEMMAMRGLPQSVRLSEWLGVVAGTARDPTSGNSCRHFGKSIVSLHIIAVEKQAVAEQCLFSTSYCCSRQLSQSNSGSRSGKFASDEAVYL